METIDLETEALSGDKAEYVGEVVSTIGGLATPEEMLVIIGGYEDHRAPQAVGALIRSHRIIEPLASELPDDSEPTQQLIPEVIPEEEEPFVDVPFGHA